MRRTKTSKTSAATRTAPGRAVKATAATTVTAAMTIALAAAALGATFLPVAGNAASAASIPLNCAAAPSACGYPDATNTGVSPTATLLSVPAQATSGPGWKWMTGTTVSNVQVANAGNNFGVSLRHTSNVTIQNSSIYSPYNTGPLRLQVAIKDIY